MIEILTEVFGANETKTFMLQGKRLELLDCIYPVDVKLMDRQGAQLSIMNKSEASFFSQPDGGFESVQITSALPQTVRFFVGSGDAGTRRTSGVVQVVDGGKARTLANRAFMLTSRVGGAAGVDAISGIWNPAGSGVNAIIKQVSCSVDATSVVYFAGHRTKLFAGAAGVASKYVVPGAAVVSKALQDFAATLAAPALDFIYLAPTIQANAPFTWMLQEPIVLAPGAGFYVDNRTPTALLNASVEFYEESIT